MVKCLTYNPVVYRFIAVLFFLTLTLNVSFAQKREQIEIVQADNLFSGERNGKKAQRLVGDVIFKHQEALMYCDSAFLYSKSNAIDAFGSIRINQGDTLNLYGEFLNYDGNTQIANVTGKEVKLISPDFILTTDRLIYDRVENVASYFTGGHIESKNDSNVLVSRVGYYYANNQLFTFKDSVVLTNPSFRMESDTLKYFTNTEMVNFLGPTTILGDSNLIYCENGWYDTKKDQSEYFDNAYLISDGKKLEGDVLYYDRTLGFGKADGNIQITDTVENMIITGEHGRVYELNDSAVVTDRSLLTQIFDNDSLFMHADTFKVYKTADGKQNLFAYYGVRIYKSDLQGICDSIVYSISDSTIKLFNDPVLWSEENQLTADRIDIRTANNKIHSLFLDQNSFIISSLDPIRYNQIKGKEMTGYFKNSKLSKIEVKGNGQTTYFAQDDEDKFIGVNVAVSSNIDITIKDKQINTITFLKRPEATMHPMGELDPETELRYKGFEWRIEEKPSRENVID
ncbi:MAG: OstA-like protein [Vicingaceae bacterium]